MLKQQGKMTKVTRNLSVTVKNVLTVIANIAMITTLARQKKGKEAPQQDANVATVTRNSDATTIKII